MTDMSKRRLVAHGRADEQAASSPVGAQRKHGNASDKGVHRSTQGRSSLTFSQSLGMQAHSLLL
jgi:hypothetical protein